MIIRDHAWNSRSYWLRSNVRTSRPTSFGLAALIESPPRKRITSSATSAAEPRGLSGRVVHAPENERNNWGARWALDQFQNRRKLLTRQLARTPYTAGDMFTAADISVTYSLNLARRRGGIVLDEVERAYMARTTGREGYQRALDACPATKGFYAVVPAL